MRYLRLHSVGTSVQRIASCCPYSAVSRDKNVTNGLVERATSSFGCLKSW